MKEIACQVGYLLELVPVQRSFHLRGGSLKSCAKVNYRVNEIPGLSIHTNRQKHDAFGCLTTLPRDFCTGHIRFTRLILSHIPPCSIKHGNKDSGNNWGY